MRTQFMYRCSDCKMENYIGTRNKTKNPDKTEVMKFCKKCNLRTLHKEKTKSK